MRTVDRDECGNLVATFFCDCCGAELESDNYFSDGVDELCEDCLKERFRAVMPDGYAVESDERSIYEDREYDARREQNQ